MMEVGAISAIGAPAPSDAVSQITVTRFDAVQTAAPVGDAGFASMLSESVAKVDAKVAKADEMVARFAVDESTPIHHVTIALEEARIAVELATQVRQKLTEGYRELMNMQL